MAASRARRGWAALLLAVLLPAVVAGGVQAQPDEIPRHMRETDPRTLITVRAPADVATRRAEVVAHIWPGSGLPNRQPDAIEPNASPGPFSTLPNLAGVDRLTVRMPYGFESYPLLLRPTSPNGELVIVHAGHNQRAPDFAHQIGAFLARGYAVLAVEMPLYGANPRPTVDVPRFGRVYFEIHQQLPLLDVPGSFSSLSLFVEPVVVALNRYAPLHTRVSMVGLSGGGWTTMLVAAIDPRISRSYPVAGNLPLYLRYPDEWGDWEQDDAVFYRMAGGLDLYVLGAAGSGRAQVQILNQYDPCCFGGTRARLYEPAVADAVGGLGAGRWTLHLDATHHQHAISDPVLSGILADLATGTFAVPSIPTVTPLPTQTPTPTATVTPTRTPTPVPPIQQVGLTATATMTTMPLPVATTSATVAASLIPTPPGSQPAAPSATPVTNAGPCSPRPPVVVRTEPLGGGRLGVTVVAGSGEIVGVVLGDRVNATVAEPVVRGNVAAFTVIRQGDGPVHAAFVVTDGCGAWPSFVGSGPSGF